MIVGNIFKYIHRNYEGLYPQHICLVLERICTSLVKPSIWRMWRTDSGNITQLTIFLLIIKPSAMPEMPCKVTQENWGRTLKRVLVKSLNLLLEICTLFAYFNNNNLLCSNQHGFVPRRSWLVQLLTAMEEWTKAIQHSKYLGVVYLDFSKVFDTVPHHHLLHKLQSYGKW